MVLDHRSSRRMLPRDRFAGLYGLVATILRLEPGDSMLRRLESTRVASILTLALVVLGQGCGPVWRLRMLPILGARSPTTTGITPHDVSTEDRPEQQSALKRRQASLHSTSRGIGA